MYIYIFAYIVLLCIPILNHTSLMDEHIALRCAHKESQNGARKFDEYLNLTRSARGCVRYMPQNTHAHTLLHSPHSARGKRSRFRATHVRGATARNLRHALTSHAVLALWRVCGSNVCAWHISYNMHMCYACPCDRVHVIVSYETRCVYILNQKHNIFNSTVTLDKEMIGTINHTDQD